MQSNRDKYCNPRYVTSSYFHRRVKKCLEDKFNKRQTTGITTAQIHTENSYMK